MTVHYQDATVTLWAGDCLDVLAELGDASVDAVVTDPLATSVRPNGGRTTNDRSATATTGGDSRFFKVVDDDTDGPTVGRESSQQGGDPRQCQENQAENQQDEAGPQVPLPVVHRIATGETVAAAHNTDGAA